MGIEVKRLLPSFTYFMNLRLNLALFIFSQIISSQAWSQKSEALLDARNTPEGREFQKVLDQKPPEVQFGIVVTEQGEVYFKCNNKEWLSNLLATDSYGISSDIISKEKYNCNLPDSDSSQMVKGQVITPVFRSELITHIKEIQDGAYSINLGKTGKSYIGKEVEGNLLFLVDHRVLAYIRFINLDRSPFHILPMGLYADTLIRSETEGSDEKSFTYSKRIQTTIPFPKSRANFNSSDFAPLYKSINLKDYHIEKIEIRAYSSVEGPKSFNDTLMHRRAEAMLTEIKKSQNNISQFNIITAENWLEFLESIKTTEFNSWSSLPKEEIKKRLLDKSQSEKLEPILSSERKAVVTVFLSRKTQYHELSREQIITEFQKALAGKKVPIALLLEQEVLNRIKDNKLPDYYIGKLEIPENSDFIPLLNEKLIFNLYSNPGSEREALKKYLVIKQLNPKNAKLNYNMVALKLRIWEKENDNSGTAALLNEINELNKLGIPPSLVKRMIINFYILQTSDQMAQADYPAKNQSLKYIGDFYLGLNLSDHEIYSLAKYFAFYGKLDWSLNLVSTRIDKLDIDEDLLFYFLNLEFYNPAQFKSVLFQKGVLNAININRSRFCRFFTPADQNGASIQLLEYSPLKKIYCGYCLNTEP